MIEHDVEMLTVGELIDILKNVNPACFIVIDNGGWYDHIRLVDVPTPDADGWDDAGLIAVTLLPNHSRPLDPRFDQVEGW